VYKQICFCPLEQSWLGNTNEFFLEDISFLPEKKVIGFQMNQKEGSQAAKPASFT